MNSTMTHCPACGGYKPGLPHVNGRCVWCARREGLITSLELAEHERQGWAAGFPTLPHTFRQDQIEK